MTDEEPKRKIEPVTVGFGVNDDGVVMYVENAVDGTQSFQVILAPEMARLCAQRLTWYSMKVEEARGAS